MEVSEEEEEKLLAEVSKLVTNGFSENPAYQMLKARFLSCFTVPALLATIQPMTCEEREENEEYDEQEEMFKKMKERSRQRRAQVRRRFCLFKNIYFNSFRTTLFTYVFVYFCIL